jgi:ATP-dependent DNA helicase RecG
MDHFLRVSFKYRENPFEYDDNIEKIDKINDKINDKKKIILDVIIKNPNVTIPEINEITKISTATISRYLKQLQEKGIIERVGSNKSGYWKII